jgi:hypothetical protein
MKFNLDNSNVFLDKETIDKKLEAFSDVILKNYSGNSNKIYDDSIVQIMRENWE